MTKRIIAIVICAVVVEAGVTIIASAQEPSGPQISPECVGKVHSLGEHKAFTNQAIVESKQFIDRADKRKNRRWIRCSPASQKMQRLWDRKHDQHAAFKHDVLRYPGGRNPVGGHKWALPYSVVVCESGAGSGSWNLYGMLQGWAYAPSWAPSSVYDASFWAQSVAAYNLRQHGLGGWSCA